MEPKELFGVERAVMPVIAVVLMIAVTVILAAIVAAFALGLGGGAGSTPQASIDFEYDAAAGNVTITHEGGDSLDEPRVTVLVDGTPDTPSADWGVAEISTGDSYVTGVSGGLAGGEEIRVRWEDDDGRTATLAVFEVPG
jgi:flagellin-like protein